MQKILKHGLPDDYVPCLVDTRIRGSRPVFGKATPSTMEAYRIAVIIGGLIIRLITSRFEVAHLNNSLSPTGIFRELICAALIRLRGIPLITHHRGNLPDFSRDNFAGLSFRALRALIRLSASNLVLNRPSQAFCMQLTRNHSHGHYTLISNFIEDCVFQRPSKRAGPPRERVRATFVGGITKAKGAIDIVALARRLPEIDFCLIGNMLTEVAPDLNPLPGNVVITGLLPHEEVIDNVASSDLFLFPSYSEGFPNAVLEAMALGLPVVATRVGAIPEMVEEGEGGFLVEPGDIAGLVSAITALAKDPILRERQGAFNREKSRRYYSYSTVTKQLTLIYNEVTNRPRETRSRLCTL